MPVYTVHAPVATSPGSDAADRFVFVRDGFRFWAFVFGPLWLAAHRLWLALLGWIVAMVVIDLGLKALGAGGATVFVANGIIALLTGFEAASLRRWTLSRGNWRQLDIVVADDNEAAERRFFDRWTAGHRNFASDPSGFGRGSPPPLRDAPEQGIGYPAPHEIIGLFPQPGAPR